jgi:serine/threonine protein kinase
VKVLDFGIARARLEGRQDTQPGVVKGKLMYLSPEQAMGKPLDGRSDVWATGLVLYRMLSGKLASDHIDAARVIYELAHGKFTPLSETAPWVPTVLGDAVARALKVSLDERYPSARAFSQELSVFLHRAAPATSESTLMGIMGSLYSRELYDEGREPTILPEVISLIDEARKMVESTPARTVPHGSPAVTEKPKTMNERVPTAPEMPDTITSGSRESITRDDDDSGPPTLRSGERAVEELSHGPVPEHSRTDSQRPTAPDESPSEPPASAPKTDAQRPSAMVRAALEPAAQKSGLPRWFLLGSILAALIGIGAVLLARG